MRDKGLKLWTVVCAASGVAIISVIAGLNAFAGSGPALTHDATVRGGDWTAATASVQVSGFTVRVTDSRATAFFGEVDVAVDGRPEVGDDLVFVPGPVLTWPDGQQSSLSTVTATGRNLSLRFDRPDGAVLEPDAEMRLLVSGILARGVTVSAEDLPAGPPEPAYLRARLSSVKNPIVHPLALSASLGRGFVAVDEIWLDGTAMRLRGHLNGFSSVELQEASLAATRLLDSNGEAWRPVFGRSGFGPDSASFEFDFEGPPREGSTLEVALNSSPSGEPSLTDELGVGRTGEQNALVALDASPR